MRRNRDVLNTLHFFGMQEWAFRGHERESSAIKANYKKLAEVIAH
jgi:hypothetical protein